MKKILSWLLVSLFIGSFHLNVSATESEETYRIAHSTMTLASPYFTAVANGVEEAAEEFGWDVVVQDPQMDVASQVTAIEDFIQQGYDGIIVAAVDSAAVVDVLKQAQEAGIKVVATSTLIEDGVDAFVSAGEHEMGYALGTAIGEWAQETLEGDIEGVTFGTINDPNVMIREEGMREGFEEKYTKGSITWINAEVGTLGGIDSDAGMKNMEGLMQSNPDIKIIMGSNDAGVLGAYEAAKAAGMNIEEMAFGGVDATQEALDLMKAEKDAGSGAYRVTVDITPFEHGKLDVEVMKQLFEDETFDEQVMVDAEAVTWDNIDSYFE